METLPGVWWIRLAGKQAVVLHVQWLMEAGAMPALMERLADVDSRVRQKALMALSCILRHNGAGLSAFVQVPISTPLPLPLAPRHAPS